MAGGKVTSVAGEWGNEAKESTKILDLSMPEPRNIFRQLTRTWVVGTGTTRGEGENEPSLTEA